MQMIQMYTEHNYQIGIRLACIIHHFLILRNACTPTTGVGPLQECVTDLYILYDLGTMMNGNCEL